MKTINVSFLDYKSSDVKEFIIYKILKSYYDVVINNDSPDYIFFTDHNLDYLNYDCIRIYYSVEQACPDFDLVDYGIGYDYLSNGDRYIRYPYYLLFRSGREHLNSIFQKIDYSNYTSKKRQFASYVTSNVKARSYRDEFFLELSKYKFVSSGGKHLNNVNKIVSNKIDFLSSHKFHLASENAIYNGYTTEKIIDAFLAKTVPIYIGNSLITEEFNKDSFINSNDYNSFNDLIEYIKEVDNDDQLYFQMLTSTKIHNGSLIPYEFELKEFLLNIFEQSYDAAIRRPDSQQAIFKKRIWIAGRKILYFYNRMPNIIKRFLKSCFK